eukprot:m.27156 g.27156  ORF g.27156 m.27156 type:complete len:173 (+) comp7868_c0_seq2:93-611(+)
MTELYDLDHGVSQLDRARAEALRAAQQAGEDGWGSSSRSQYEEFIENLTTQVSRILIELDRDSNDVTKIPASQKFISELEHVHPCSEDIAEHAQCPVCMVPLEEEDIIVALSCDHIFHPDCVVPWLQKRNNCPVCRQEFPTDDPSYEAKKKESQRAEEREAEREQLHNAMFG